MVDVTLRGTHSHKFIFTSGSLIMIAGDWQLRLIITCGTYHPPRCVPDSGVYLYGRRVLITKKQSFLKNNVALASSDDL